MSFYSRDKPCQRGMALVIALLVVAIVSLLATTVTSNFLLSFRQLEMQLAAQQSWAYLSFAEGVAMQLLAQDQAEQEDQAFVDHLAEPWAEPFSYPSRVNEESVHIVGGLTDIEGRFNLNQLAEPAPENKRFTVHQQRFIRLLQSLEAPYLDESEAIAITEAVIDWVDTNTTVTGHGGAEDIHYSDRERPLRAANREMAVPSELRWVKGMTSELFKALEPHVTVWPSRKSILNINTASAEVLRTLNQDGDLRPLSKADGELIVEQRSEGPWSDLSIFETGVLAGRGINAEGVGVSSRHFMLNAEVQIGERTFVLSSIIHRSPERSRIVARSQGGW